MCLAIVKPADARLDHDAMARAYAANPDGCGFAVRQGRTVVIHKGLWTFAEFWARFAPYQETEALVHFRWATAGRIDDANCHPFALHGGGALIHNGHVDGYGTLQQSDTAAWVTTVLNPLLALYPDALTRAPIQHLLAQSLVGSKVAILTATDVHIVHEDRGHWHDGSWYSNRSYAPLRATPVPAGPPPQHGTMILCSLCSEDEATVWNEAGQGWTCAACAEALLCDLCGENEAEAQSADGLWLCATCATDEDDAPDDDRDPWQEIPTTGHRR